MSLFSGPVFAIRYQPPAGVIPAAAAAAAA
jgi:hypothetical protein